MKNTKKIITTLGLTLSMFFYASSTNAKAQTYNIKAGIVNTSGSNLNVRSNASVSSSSITQVKNNSYLTILNEKNNFYYVEYSENKYGYVSKDYITIKSSSSAYVNTNGINLNVRYGAGTNYSIFEKIKDKDYVVVLSSQDYWSKVLFEGNKIGYVYNPYLLSSLNYSQINLNVISYKQYDSRWKGTYIKQTGKTIGQIGCLTTCVAMNESYKQNETILPTNIMNTSLYTSSGNLYWPNGYSFSTSKANYLATIYNLLKSGNPVIIGCNSNSGNQHWVVVYGYKGGNTLQASNFLINDPGSASRTTLSQFLSDYPNFYKIAYNK